MLVIVLGLVLSKPAPQTAILSKDMPAFSLPDLYTGEAVTNTAFKSEWALVNIWATWCSPCKQEHAVLLDIAKTTKIPIIGIDFKDNPADAKTWLKNKGNPYTQVLMDESGRTVFEWGAIGVPETWLIDPQGVIRQRFAGILTKAVWERDFAPLMAGKP